MNQIKKVSSVFLVRFLLVPLLRRLILLKRSFLTLHGKEITIGPFINTENQVNTPGSRLPYPPNVTPHCLGLKHSIYNSNGRILSQKQVSISVP